MSQRDKPRQSLKNNTAGVREREDENRTREAGNRDQVEGVVANTLNSFRNGAVGFIDWLDLVGQSHHNVPCVMPMTCGALDDVWSGKVLSWLAIAHVHCVAVDDVDVCEVLTANLWQVS